MQLLLNSIFMFDYKILINIDSVIKLKISKKPI